MVVWGYYDLWNYGWKWGGGCIFFPFQNGLWVFPAKWIRPSQTTLSSQSNKILLIWCKVYACCTFIVNFLPHLSVRAPKLFPHLKSYYFCGLTFFQNPRTTSFGRKSNPRRNSGGYVQFPLGMCYSAVGMRRKNSNDLVADYFLLCLHTCDTPLG